MLIEEFQKLPSVGPKSAERLTYFLLRAPDQELASLAEAIRGLKKGIQNCSVCYNYAQEDPCGICADKDRQRDLICVVEEPLDVLAIEKTGKFAGVYHVLGGRLNPVAGIGPEEIRVAELVRRVGRLNWSNLERRPAAEHLTRFTPPAKEAGGEDDTDYQSKEVITRPLGFGSGPAERGSERLAQSLTKAPSALPVEIILATNPTLEGEATAMFVKKKLKELNLGIKITRIARGLPTGGDLGYADEITVGRALEGRSEY